MSTKIRLTESCLKNKGRFHGLFLQEVNTMHIMFRSFNKRCFLYGVSRGQVYYLLTGQLHALDYFDKLDLCLSMH